MAGLLDNPDALQAIGLLGQGIAARNVPAYANQAMGLLAGAEQRRMQQAMQQMQMRQFQIQLDREQRAAQTEDQLRQAAKDAYAMPTQGGFGIGMNGEQMATPKPAFDMKRYVDSVMGIDPMKGLAIQRAMQKDETPITVAPGASLVDRRTMKPVFTAPKETSLPSAVQEYQFAQQQGYQGTFEQWDRERKKAGAVKVEVPINMGQKGLDNELSIHSKWRQEPIYKAHQEVKSAYSQIKAALAQQSPAGDLAGATKIMKMLDPGSVVRESELGMAMAASGALDRLTHYAENIIKGTKLTPTQRRDFQTLADALNAESTQQYNAKRAEYAGFATDYGLNADRIVGAEERGATVQKPAQGAAKVRRYNPATGRIE